MPQERFRKKWGESYSLLCLFQPLPGSLRAGGQSSPEKARDWSEACGFLFPQGVEFVEPLDEEQVSELLNDGKRVRDPACPHRVPDPIDF